MEWKWRSQRVTFYEIGWPIPGDRKKLFSEVALGGFRMRLLDKGVHLRALEQAERKLDELLRRSGPRKAS